jgi:uncharacterized repeat protein (TIGR04042 family)
MPEMYFRVRWPDGKVEDCYSPSTVIAEHLTAGSDYPLAEFLDRARTALEAANERVRARYGMGCGQALNQLASIERTVAAFSDRAALVHIDSLLP